MGADWKNFSAEFLYSQESFDALVREVWVILRIHFLESLVLFRSVDKIRYL